MSLSEESSKLVRNKIPSIISATGRCPLYRFALGKEYSDLLSKKLLEETQELFEAFALGKPESLIEEISDVFDVLIAICENKNISITDLISKNLTKNKENGSFSEGVILEKILSSSQSWNESK